MTHLQATYGKDERGFALIETLIAAAIAAGVIGAIGVALATSLKASQRSAQTAASLTEATIISARLHAGLPKDAILIGLESWTLEAEPFDVQSTTNNGDATMYRISVGHVNDPQLSFSTLIVAPGDWRDE